MGNKILQDKLDLVQKIATISTAAITLEKEMAACIEEHTRQAGDPLVDADLVGTAFEGRTAAEVTACITSFSAFTGAFMDSPGFHGTNLEKLAV